VSFFIFYLLFLSIHYILIKFQDPHYNIKLESCNKYTNLQELYFFSNIIPLQWSNILFLWNNNKFRTYHKGRWHATQKVYCYLLNICIKNLITWQYNIFTFWLSWNWGQGESARPYWGHWVTKGWQWWPEGGSSYSPGVVDADYSLLHPRLSVHGEEPHPTRGDPVCAEHSRSKEVNLEKQSPILQCECRA